MRRTWKRFLSTSGRSSTSWQPRGWTRSSTPPSTGVSRQPPPTTLWHTHTSPASSERERDHTDHDNFSKHAHVGFLNPTSGRTCELLQCTLTSSGLGGVHITSVIGALIHTHTTIPQRVRNLPAAQEAMVLVALNLKVLCNVLRIESTLSFLLAPEKSNTDSDGWCFEDSYHQH